MNRSVLTRKGFTLTEATIAMVVLSFATAAVILPFSTGAAMNMEGAKRTIAAKLAADKLEEVQKNSSIYLEMFSGFVPPEVDGSFTDENGVYILTDPVYSNYDRLVDCNKTVVRGEDLWLVTVTVQYDNLEVLQMSKLMEP